MLSPQHCTVACCLWLLLVWPSGLLAQRPLPPPESLEARYIRILVSKSNYTLSLFYKGELLKVYSVVFGKDPVNDKRYEGDRCTPEGIFRIKEKYPQEHRGYFLWLDYPNQDSWNKYYEARAAGRIPKNAGIGGEIGIHGVPPRCDYFIEDRINWTKGCVALTLADITELYRYIPVGTEVEIRK